VYAQIEQALERLDSSSKQSQEKIKAILKRYATGEIGIDEAYYDLLESGLIPTPRGAACLPRSRPQQKTR